jgi:magnesium-transporting ATPase (P-type)
VCSYWIVTGRPESAQDLKIVARIALSAAFVCVQVLFLLLFLAYRNDGSPYAGSSWVLQVFYQIFLWFLAFLYQRDANDRETYGTNLDKFTFVQSTAIFATVLVSAALTIIAVVDVTSHSGG